LEEKNIMSQSSNKKKGYFFSQLLPVVSSGFSAFVGLGNPGHNIRADIKGIEITISLVDLLGNTESLVLCS